jgi:hypothetical protein
VKFLSELNVGDCFIPINSPNDLEDFPLYQCFHLWKVTKKGNKLVLANRCLHDTNQDDEFPSDMLVMLVV